MRKIILLFTVLIVSASLSAQQAVSIIPKPVSLVVKQGVFTIDANISLKYVAGDHDLHNAASFLVASIKELSGITLRQHLQATKTIQFIIQKTEQIGNEGYLLKVNPTSIIIQANTKAGIIYGIQTLLQTLPCIRTNALLQVPCMSVTDYPRFQWRGMHLDVSRHFFSSALVKEYINLMARYKMNRFHWHLVDDQGWRIEIKKYPRLTAIGAWRVDQSDKVWGSRPQAKEGEPATYGGYYTQEQIKDIVAYAAQRNVTIVPEIEMPGHVASAIAAYPELCCSRKPQLPLTGGDYTNISSNYCAGNDSVFTFLQDVLSEVMQLFPSTYIHIGGDEVDKTSWKNCIRCQSRIKAEGLKNEEELQSYFIKRIEKFIVSKHRKMIGWDEILEGGLAPEATVMSWRGESGGIEAAKMHHDVIMTPGVPCYFDHYQAGPEGEPLAIGGMNTLKRVYDYEPIPKELNEQQSHYVLGAQANVWTEYISTAEHLEYMVLPRMLALAEVVWSQPSAKNWNNFYHRLQPSFRYFDQKGLHYSKGSFTVTIHPKTINGKLLATLSTEIPGAAILYTTDGTEPSLQSKTYTVPVSIDSSLLLKAVTLANGAIMNIKPSQQQFVIHAATGTSVTYVHPVSRYYMADGPNSLTDGIRGTLEANKYWHGFNGKDLIATIDLKKDISIHKVSLGCLQRYSDWIFLPQYVDVEVSSDGVTYKKAGSEANTIAATETNPMIKDFSVSFEPIPVRFIRVIAKVLNSCPAGHPGEGKPAWLFADELIVE